MCLYLSLGRKWPFISFLSQPVLRWMSTDRAPEQLQCLRQLKVLSKDRIESYIYPGRHRRIEFVLFTFVYVSDIIVLQMDRRIFQAKILMQVNVLGLQTIVNHSQQLYLKAFAQWCFDSVNFPRDMEIRKGGRGLGDGGRKLFKWLKDRDRLA